MDLKQVVKIFLLKQTNIREAELLKLFIMHLPGIHHYDGIDQDTILDEDDAVPDYEGYHQVDVHIVASAV